MKKYRFNKNKLIYEQTYDFKSLFILSLIINVILLLVILKIESKIILKREKIVIEKVINDIELNDSAILNELIDLKCILPNIALAQFKVETGHFSSPICKENKNIGGIRTSKSKYVKGMNRGHCVYATYKDCLKDYVLIQNRYLATINGKYAEAKNYINVLKSIK